MSRIATLVLAALALFGAAAPVLADDVAAPRVQQREQNLQNRIDKGEQSGQLTPKEANRLQRKQDRLDRREERMASDGKLTGRERGALNREENRESRDVRRLKRNNRQAAPAEAAPAN